MRIVSMVPSATEILCAIGMAEDIVGISHDCDYPVEILKRPRLTRTMLPSDLTSCEIDQRVRSSIASKRSLYAIDAELLESLRPDLVVTQQQCSVCAVDRDRTVCALESLNLDAKSISLSATGFCGLYEDILNVGSATERRSQAEALIAALASRLEQVEKQTASEPRPRVFCLSWFDPLMSAGKWISEMVTLAGGGPCLGSERDASSRIDVHQLRDENPEIIFLLPCSFSQSRAADEWAALRDLPPWREFSAIRQGRVFAVESSLFHRLGPRLVNGVELLAALIHPERVSFGAELDLLRRVV